jgi:UDP-N-acetylglucosamine--N-acetylmuramyl-(pentapeptide) pyrophosphoryl-undecaprenol N-acetylglucosamine transferase
MCQIAGSIVRNIKPEHNHLMSPSSTILFAGGGTGGHLFPGIAVADELRRRDASTRIVFVGSSRSIESTIVAEHRLEHRMLPVEPLPTLKRNPLRFIYRNWQAWRTATRLLNEFRPSAVVGLGGYASAPLVWEASRRHIPVVLIEQNVIPGRTTRWLSRFANDVCVSFPETNSRLPRARRINVTGNPVRADIATLHNRPLVAIVEESASSPPRELLILGGSQGADSLNAAVLAAFRKLSGETAGWKIVHQTGPRDVDLARRTYESMGLSAVVEPFFHEMSSLYGRANLVISRAGATTLAELACAGTAMILLPYPFAADDHQRANAQVFVDHKAAVMVEHAATPEKTADELVTVLRSLLIDAELRKQMGIAAREFAHPNAAQMIANVIESAGCDR